ncbi:beta-lactamase [Dictyobacter sp. S3.2.2.5]|uniref:Beta-lactamase n=1 Tax=Dictyobacter halimunensis TaxID=3026934 RepID=A0ABQ6FMM9_9CHLR|nr:beta-lactamase [Dictyobacter sp. S3.2.2.5]
METQHAHVRNLLLALWLALLLVSFPTGTDARVTKLTQQPTFVEKLIPLLSARQKQMRVPGAIIYVDVPGKGTWTAGMGTDNLKTNAPINVKDHMRIGSVTKTMVGTVILQLVQEKKVHLDDPIRKYLPHIKNGQSITIRQLLNMTSGLFDYVEDRSYRQTLDQHPDKAWKSDELVAISMRHAPYSPPGQQYRYSNTNFILLGQVIERVTHTAANVVLQQRIFQPLGMYNTLLPLQNQPAMPQPYAQGYMFGSNLQSIPRPHMTRKEAIKVGDLDRQPNNVTDLNHSFSWTSGGVVSDLEDLKIWARALATGKLLNPALQRERLNWLPINESSSYGLGIAKFTGLLGHNGSTPGYTSFVAYQPVTKTTVIILTNLYIAPDGTNPANEMAKAVIQTIGAGTVKNTSKTQAEHTSPIQPEQEPRPTIDNHSNASVTSLLMRMQHLPALFLYTTMPMGAILQRK